MTVNSYAAMGGKKPIPQHHQRLLTAAALYFAASFALATMSAGVA